MNCEYCEKMTRSHSVVWRRTNGQLVRTIICGECDEATYGQKTRTGRNERIRWERVRQRAIKEFGDTLRIAAREAVYGLQKSRGSLRISCGFQGDIDMLLKEEDE